MKSLFVKVLGLCFLVILTSLLANGYIRAFTMGMDKPHRDAFATLLTVEMDEARQSWETGGKPALADTMVRLQKMTKYSNAVLTDANGIDLLTGQNRHDLVNNAVNRSRFGYSGGGPDSFARISPDHRYWFFVMGAKSLIAPLEWQYRLFAMGLAAIPCYVLSWWLALPLLRLRRAMHKFGDGDLSARADPRRQDDFGDVARAFNKMADRIQTLMGAERRLLRDVSHELRSPLARLQVAVEIARANGSDRLLDQVQQESERLDELIDQLLEWSKTEGRLCPAKTEAVRLDLLAARIADSCEIEAEVRGCRLHLNTASAITVSGTSELLHRAVENVLRNAVRFAPPDSAIEIAVTSVGSEAHIVVRDYGPGVREEALVRLFEPFYREPSNAQDDRGLGLGLAIARRAVELHGGSIDASNAHPGLRVRIAIPVMAAADNDGNAVLVSKRA